MKCQQCDKQAVFHITELETGEVRELHLCEDHARGYLNQAEAAMGGAEESSGGGLTGPLTIEPHPPRGRARRPQPGSARLPP